MLRLSIIPEMSCRNNEIPKNNFPIGCFFDTIICSIIYVKQFFWIMKFVFRYSFFQILISLYVPYLFLVLNKKLLCRKIYLAILSIFYFSSLVYMGRSFFIDFVILCFFSFFSILFLIKFLWYYLDVEMLE